MGMSWKDTGEWGKPKEFALYRLSSSGRPSLELACALLGRGWRYFKADEEAQS